jgi:hypothetical protein
MTDLLRDELLLRQVLRRKLLRSIIRAVSVLDASGRGKDVGEEAFRSATLLARLLPRFVTDSQPQDNDPFSDPEWWTVEKLIQLERLGGYQSPEQAASMWRICFDKHGPQEGLFQTRPEAGEYGRWRYRELQGCYNPEENLYDIPPHLQVSPRER